MEWPHTYSGPSVRAATASRYSAAWACPGTGQVHAISKSSRQPVIVPSVPRNAQMANWPGQRTHTAPNCVRASSSTMPVTSSTHRSRKRGLAARATRHLRRLCAMNPPNISG